MRARLTDFASSMGLTLTDRQFDVLLSYADLVWEKKDFLNLTSVADKKEIFTRHICDGLAGAAYIARAAGEKGSFSVADMGAGAGYIGLTCAAVLPQARVTLVESLEKRCAFLNWVLLKTGLKNVSVLNRRLGQQNAGLFDFVTERAMGRLNDVLPLIVPALKEGGVFVAYQSLPDEAQQTQLLRLGLRRGEVFGYTLPDETKQRFLTVFAAQGGNAA